jgi:uncharacterized protein (DUF1015 family)
MSQLIPFRALRPAPAAAHRVASVPYDVVNVDEARALVAKDPLSFLRVTRSEVDLPPDTDPYAEAVYLQAAENFEDLKRAAPMIHDEEPSLYFYRLTMGAHVQIGLAGCFSVDEYNRGLIKKHEKTRKDKEDDRTRHILELRAQTGVVFLTYRASPPVSEIAARVVSTSPLYTFGAEEGIVHELWQVTGADTDALVAAFAELPALYIADGHHRAASASRAHAADVAAAVAGESGAFIAVAFPDTEMQILPYNRVVKDLGGQTPDQFLAALKTAVRVTSGSPTPSQRGRVSMYFDGAWHELTLPPPAPEASRDDALDVAVLQSAVLEPVLAVGDPRSDKRIDFVGGARGTIELERLVDSGAAAVAFSLAPTTIDDLIAIADAGGIMPPKSTWFEPKLRDGLLVHLI